MGATRRPKFTTLNAMIVIAAAALAMALSGVWPFSNLPRVGGFFTAVHFLILMLYPHLAAATLALLAIRLSPPRPRRARLTRQPGAIACASASVALLATGVGVAATFGL